MLIVLNPALNNAILFRDLPRNSESAYGNFANSDT